jgi:phosphoglycerol transferase MdoB-like AlkP superfamily enzyme
MDLAPTLLGMLGISYDAPFMGCDINKVPIGQERAFISTYQNLGYIKGDTLVMLGPRKDVTQYQIKDWMKSEYVQQTPDPTLTDEAITWYQSAYELYRAGLLKQTN